MPHELQTLILELRKDTTLDEPGRLLERLAALDRLDTLFPDELSHASGSIDAETRRRVRGLRTRLDAANQAVYLSIREEIQHGQGTGKLLQFLPNQQRCTAGDGYDDLDELATGVLQLNEPETDAAHPAQEMVFYQPTPARHIFDFIHRIALNERDLLVDLGSGLGHVALLAAICACARVLGIEIEPAYVACARQCAHALNLKNVTFLHQDARSADLSRGTVFFLYTPFTGTILRTVLDRLQMLAATREIRVGSFGPCTPTIAQEPWLIADSPVEPGRIAIFRSRPSLR